MPDRRKPLTAASSGAVECTHAPHLSVWIRRPGQSDLLACTGCRAIKDTSAPWREASPEELDAIHRAGAPSPSPSSRTAGATLDAPTRSAMDAILAERVYLVPPKPTETVAHLKEPEGPGARCGSDYGYWLAASPSVCAPLPTPDGVPLAAGFILIHGKRRLELCGKCIVIEAGEKWPGEFLRSRVSAERLRETFETMRARAEALEGTCGAASKDGLKGPLESTINRYAVASKGRGLTAIVAVPGWMDRQQALNLVAWLSVIAELEDEEILAARRQVEAT